MRRCSSCSKELPETTEHFAFRKDTGSWRAQCRVCVNARMKPVYAAFRARNPSYHHDYYAKPENGERERARNRAYARAHPEIMRAAIRKYQARIRATPRGILINRMRSRMWHALERMARRGVRCRRDGRLLSSLPYSIDELARHLEARFRDGMSWENLGEWHIDHIRPIASFSAFDSVADAEFQECWALTNLQPLWGAENRAKHARWHG